MGTTLPGGFLYLLHTIVSFCKFSSGFAKTLKIEIHENMHPVHYYIPLGIGEALLDQALRAVWLIKKRATLKDNLLIYSCVG